jgi:hypothetical protein
LNRLGGPVEPVSDQPICAGLSPAIFFQSRSTFLTGRRSVTCPFFVALHLFLLHAVTPCLVTSLAHSVLFFLAAALQTAASVSAISLSGHFPGTQIFFCLLPLSGTAGPVWSPVWCACRTFFFACSVWSLPPCRARSFFVFLALHADTFALSGHLLAAAPVRAIFSSLIHCFAQRLWHGRNRPCVTAGTTPPDARYLHASGESFIWSTAGVRMQIFYYLFCPVTSSLLSACRFSWTFLLCPRTSHACVSGAPIFFLSSHFQQLRANLNFSFFPLLFLVL